MLLQCHSLYCNQSLTFQNGSHLSLVLPAGALGGRCLHSKASKSNIRPFCKNGLKQPSFCVKVGSCLSPSAPSPPAHLQHRDLGSCWPGHLWTASQPKHRTLNQRAYYIGVSLCYGWLQGTVKKPPKRIGGVVIKLSDDQSKH